MTINTTTRYSGNCTCYIQQQPENMHASFHLHVHIKLELGKQNVKIFYICKPSKDLLVSVGEDSYQSRSKMNWRDPEFDQHKPKPWAQAEKC